jgi:hypothetical protein
MSKVELVSSRLYEMKDYARAMADHEQNASTTRKVRHPSLGLCIEVIYIPSIQEGGK